MMLDVVIAHMNVIEQYGVSVVVLALTRYAKVSPRLMEALLQHYGQLEEILLADTESLSSIDGLGPEEALQIEEVTTQLEAAEEYLRQLNDRDINVVTRFDDEYPQRLFELNDPPPLLFYRGNLPTPDKKLLGIAGTVNASNDGIELTTNLTRQAASAGVDILSTLRGGIDLAAHLGVRTGDGTSYAVLDSGFDDPGLFENMPVVIDIVGSGGVLSEWMPDVDTNTSAFTSSNRLVAAMAQAVVITEIDQDAARTRDLLECAEQIGSMLFVLIDPHLGGLADEKSLQQALDCGAIPMVGIERIPDILNALV